MSRDISIQLSADEVNFIRSAFSERFGGSASEFLSILNLSTEELCEVSQEFDNALAVGSKMVRLTDSMWRIIYDVINAVIYALGPFELELITGFNLQQAAQTNLRICSKVWNVYAGAKWSSN